MRAHSRKSSARSVRADGVTATSNAHVDLFTQAMPGTLGRAELAVQAVPVNALCRKT